MMDEMDVAIAIFFIGGLLLIGWMISTDLGVKPMEVFEGNQVEMGGNIALDPPKRLKRK